jgi:hypothetical protein
MSRLGIVGSDEHSEVPGGRQLRSSLRLHYNFDYQNIVDGMFLARVLDEQLTTVRGDAWITSAGAEAAPGDLLATASYFHAGRFECLIRLNSAVAHLILRELALTVRVAATDATACDAAYAQIKSAMPEDGGVELHVPVRFWWWQPDYAQEMARIMPAPRWDDVASNYSHRTLSSLEPLMRWSTVPSRGGRLVLWHGAPGTGKTTAVRALASQWRLWAEFQFITDPEQFLSNPGYLLRTLADGHRSTSGSSPRNRWRILVLEDSGEYLAPDAKQHAGQALSRLLNVCDGVLGQATRSLVLVTTNESVGALHPALSRPGRCLAKTEFRELTREEIAAWCAARDLAAPAAKQASLADLFAHAEGRTPASAASSFGFMSGG